MLQVSNVSLRFGKRVLFEEVNIKFTEGNCYGLIGANGAGKSTFLKILSGEIESQTGSVSMNPGERMSILKQNHFEYEEVEVLQTVIMGNKRLYDIMLEKDAIYLKEDFTEADGNKAADLEAEFAELVGALLQFSNSKDKEWYILTPDDNLYYIENFEIKTDSNEKIMKL